MLKTPWSAEGKLTLFERLTARIPFPYWVRCILVAVLVGPPMQFFSALADTGSLDKAFSFTFLVAYSNATNPTAVPLVQGLTAQAFWTASIFIVVYAPSFMRGKLAAYEADLVPLAPLGEETIRKAFGGVFRLARCSHEYNSGSQGNGRRILGKSAQFS